jgi:hypothetical protein
MSWGFYYKSAALDSRNAWYQIDLWPEVLYDQTIIVNHKIMSVLDIAEGARLSYHGPYCAPTTNEASEMCMKCPSIYGARDEMPTGEPRQALSKVCPAT